MASSHYSLGQLLRKLNRLKDAEQSYRTAQSILTELTQQFPAVKDYFDSLASSHNGLGNLLADGEQLEQALEQYRLAASLRERLVREHPQIPEYSIDLAGVYCNTASKLFDANKPADSLVWFGKAIELLEPIYQSPTKSRKCASYLEDCYQGRSLALDKLQRHARGESDWDKYVGFKAPVDKTRWLTKRWKRLLRQGMVKEAIERVDELTKLPSQDADLWYEFACIYSLAADRSPTMHVAYADRAWSC